MSDIAVLSGCKTSSFYSQIIVHELQYLHQTDLSPEHYNCTETHSSLTPYPAARMQHIAAFKIQLHRMVTKNSPTLGSRYSELIIRIHLRMMRWLFCWGMFSWCCMDRNDGRPPAAPHSPPASSDSSRAKVRQGWPVM